MKAYAMTGVSLGGVAVGFITSSIPFLQFAALAISIAAGAKSLWDSFHKKPQ